MKSIKINLAVAIGIFISQSAVQAQENKSNFTGWEIGMGVASQSNSNDYQGFLTSTSKSHDTIPFVQASYGWSLATNSPWVVTLGGRYDFEKANYGSTTYTSGGTQTVTAKYKTGFSVFIEPGYTVNPNLLVYGKISLNKANGEFTDTGAASGTTNHSGHGLGIGVATQFTEKWVGRFEIVNTTYSREPGNLSTGKPKSTEANISIGYKF